MHVPEPEGDRLGDNEKEQRYDWALRSLLNSTKALSKKQSTTLPIDYSGFFGDFSLSRRSRGPVADIVSLYRVLVTKDFDQAIAGRQVKKARKKASRRAIN